MKPLRFLLPGHGVPLALLLFACAGNSPPLPDHRIAADGSAAARHFRNGEFSAALKSYERALADARRFDVPLLQARYLFNIGRIHYERASHERALDFFDESAGLFAAAGAGDDAAAAHIFGALTRAFLGDAAGAGRTIRQTVISARSNNAAVAAVAKTIVELLEGNLAAATDAADEAQLLLRRQRDLHGIGTLFYYRAMIAYNDNDVSLSQRYLDSSLIFFDRSPERYRNWRTLLARSIVAYCENNVEAGNRYYRRAVETAPDMVTVPSKEMISTCPRKWHR